MHLLAARVSWNCQDIVILCAGPARPFQAPLDQCHVSLLVIGNCVPVKTVHRDEEQLESAAQCDDTTKSLQPKKGPSYGGRPISGGRSSARGLCVFSSKGEEGRQRRRAEAVLLVVFCAWAPTPKWAVGLPRGQHSCLGTGGLGQTLAFWSKPSAPMLGIPPWVDFLC